MSACDGGAAGHRLWRAGPALAVGGHRLAAEREAAECLRDRGAVRVEIEGEAVDLVEKGDDARAESRRLGCRKRADFLAKARDAPVEPGEVDGATLGKHAAGGGNHGREAFELGEKRLASGHLAAARWLA